MVLISLLLSQNQPFTENSIDQAAAAAPQKKLVDKPVSLQEQVQHLREISKNNGKKYKKVRLGQKKRPRESPEEYWAHTGQRRYWEEIQACQEEVARAYVLIMNSSPIYSPGDLVLVTTGEKRSWWQPLWEVRILAKCHGLVCYKIEHLDAWAEC